MKKLIKQILKENVLIHEIGTKRMPDTDVIFRNNDIVILVPKSFESSKSFSRGTQYCTGGDCGNSDARNSDARNRHQFNYHSDKGDILFRIFFKDKTKIRLTWGSDEFHWGLGRKEDYHVFTDSRQFGDSNNPLDFTTLHNVRKQQLKLQPSWNKWLNYEKDYLNNKKVNSIWDLDDDDIDELLDKRNYIVGPSGYWWNDGKEKLYKYMLKLPNEALNKIRLYKDGHNE